MLIEIITMLCTVNGFSLPPIDLPNLPPLPNLPSLPDLPPLPSLPSIGPFDCPNFTPPTWECAGPNNHHASFLNDAPESVQHDASLYASFAQDMYQDPTLDPMNPTYRLSFHHVSPGNMLAYSIFQEREEHGCDAIVSFRGSISLDDWETDFTATLSDCHIQGRGCGKYHTGIYKGWESVRASLFPELLKIIPQNQSQPCKLHVVGHSLGAGMANIASLEFKRMGFPLQSVYTYGTPRTGTPRYERIWRDELTNQGVDTLRIYSIDSNDHVDPITATGWTPIYADSTETPLAILVPFTCDGSDPLKYLSFLQCIRKLHNANDVYFALTTALVAGHAPIVPLNDIPPSGSLASTSATASIGFSTASSTATSSSVSSSASSTPIASLESSQPGPSPVINSAALSFPFGLLSSSNAPLANSNQVAALGELPVGSASSSSLQSHYPEANRTVPVASSSSPTSTSEPILSIVSSSSTCTTSNISYIFAIAIILIM